MFTIPYRCTSLLPLLPGTTPCSVRRENEGRPCNRSHSAAPIGLASEFQVFDGVYVFGYVFNLLHEVFDIVVLDTAIIIDQGCSVPGFRMVVKNNQVRQSSHAM